jgi:Putative Actinobacterial Holin-X, holin superfamily III
MPTPVSEAARNVAEHASSVAKLELRLATLELKKKAGSFAVGIGLGAGAALLALFMLAFGFATIAAVLATFLSWWLALLIVTLALLLLSGLLGMLALRAIKRGSPPIPEQAIQEAKLTSAAIKS